MEQLTFWDTASPTVTARPRVRELPSSEQPLYRLREVGPTGISNTELLACVLQSPSALQQAEGLLLHFTDLATMARADEVELTALHGIGPMQAARIRAAFELGKRLFTTAQTEHDQVRSPGDAANILIAWIGQQEQEHFAVLHLDTRNRIIHREILYKGSLNTSLVRTGEVFKTALRRNCAGVIVAHNHPSGDPSPSPEDIALTRRLVQAGKTLEVDVLDHLVIGHNRWISLRERGLGFEEA
jgi:DNA repair protein RadC